MNGDREVRRLIEAGVLIVTITVIGMWIYWALK
jgi:hypothetical protein